MTTSESPSAGWENPESGDPGTSGLYGEQTGEPAGEPERIETNLDSEEQLMSSDEDPLPDEEVSDPNSTPQGPLS